MSTPDGTTLWQVVILRIAKDEGHRILTDIQYEHIKDVERRLAYYPRRAEIADLDIEHIGEIYELKEKGGPLGKINLRVFFGAIPERTEVVVLKTYKKEKEKHTPPHIIIAAEDRFDDYKNGLLVHGNTVYVPQNK